MSPRASQSDIVAFFRPDNKAPFPEISAKTDARPRRLGCQIDETHSDKRSEILAATRRQLNVSSLKNLTMRKLSNECNASIQTIYNLVGGKDDIFVYSILDYCEQISYRSFDLQSVPDKFILTWMRMVADSAVANPIFTRNVTDEYAVKSNLLRMAVRRRIVDLLSQSLDQSSDSHRGLVYMDSRSLSERLLCLMEKSMQNWAANFNAPRSKFDIYDEFTKDALLVLG